MSFHLPSSSALDGREFSWILFSYCLGCFAAGYYWTRWRTGQDIRQLGSGTVGARNVGRALGWGGFTVTLMLDFCKGMAAVGGAHWLGLRPEPVAATVVAVVAGHNWPLQLRFHGGKGIAVSLGALLVYEPFIALCLVAVFLPLFAITRLFTTSGMLAYGFGPLMVFLCGLDKVKVAAVSIVAILVLIAHRRNIREELARISGERPVKGSPAPMHKGPNEEV
ncbi:MAG TPA: glycerol-3-phosphate acyltransferase [Verrucomicrobiae bacterium]|nr:glycerol-3-phosphate acyltransferase [Verrucomicrobiae bacterium]